MTEDPVDGTTGAGIAAEIVATGEVIVEVIGEETAEEIGAAGDLSGAHMAVLIAGTAGTHRSGVRNSSPKC